MAALRSVPQTMFQFPSDPHDPRGLLASITFYGIMVTLVLCASRCVPTIALRPPAAVSAVSLGFRLPAPPPPVSRRPPLPPPPPPPVARSASVLAAPVLRAVRPTPQAQSEDAIVVGPGPLPQTLGLPLPRVVEAPQVRRVLGPGPIAPGASMGIPSSTSIFERDKASTATGPSGGRNAHPALPEDGPGRGRTGQVPCGPGPCSLRAGLLPAQSSPAPTVRVPIPVDSTALVVLFRPPVVYPDEARSLGIQGDVVLRATFTADGRVVVLSVVRGLGCGLDEEAERVVEQIRFKPATRAGIAVDVTTNVTISFQLA